MKIKQYSFLLTLIALISNPLMPKAYADISKINIIMTATLTGSACSVDSGDTVEVNFNSIPVTAFKTIGTIATGVTPEKRTIIITCSHVADYSNLSMSILADNVSGNALVSDNPDVGFVIANKNGTEIAPNKPMIPIFVLDAQSRAMIIFQIWPVSVTGKTPKNGPIKSVGWIQINYD